MIASREQKIDAMLSALAHSSDIEKELRKSLEYKTVSETDEEEIEALKEELKSLDESKESFVEY